ncbi:MAG: alkaline phosphatase family protein [Polyangiaceae bacterium]|nr:alkaline phosphatase family protein [Polyangiaceae bacterium]
MAKKTVTRRDALKSLGATAAGTTLVACSDDTDTGPEPDPGPGKITHVVVLMMENRSYDHVLGSRALLEALPGDGLTESLSNPDIDGVERAIYRESIWCVADPPHGWDRSREQFNDGQNDGFMRAYQASAGASIEPHVMGYFTREDLPVTHALADAYTSCDRWFCSVMGPTWPNRFYFHAAQSAGLKTNDSPTDAIPTIYDRLDEKGIAWEYYYTDLPFLWLLGAKHSQPATPSFFDAAAAGTLPPFTVIDPGFALNDDHPPHHPLLGQQFIAAVYQALATSPHWENVLFIVTYDEHGGFFDHVAPPKAADDRAAEGFDQLGFRVPSLIMGPYVRPGHVSSVQYDHTSIMKHLEVMFDLEPLTARDAAANDLSDAIDQERLEANDPAAPIQLPAIDIDAENIDPACKTELRMGEKSDIEIIADRGDIPVHLDLRHKRYETAFFIGDFLEKHGIGSLRRKK